MKRIKKQLLFFTSILFFTATVHAATFDLRGARFGINGYGDLEYTYMEKTPMAMSSGMIGTMPEMSSLDQNHLNLIFAIEKGKYSMHVNIRSQHAYSTHDGTKGSYELQETFGQYIFSEYFVLRFGNFLAPIGLYNDIRYATPLYATIVLPQLYQSPMFYSGDEALFPEHANLMISGTHLSSLYDIDYSLYISEGTRGVNGLDENKDKGVGARLKFTLLENYKLGFSFFTIRNSLTEGREKVFASDLSITLFDNFLLESEFAFEDYNKRKDKISYYSRLIYNIDKFSPFIAYDHFVDYGEAVFKNGMNRIGTGFGYNFSEDLTFKVEYHYHKLTTTSGLPDGTDKFHMFRSSIIFTF